MSVNSNVVKRLKQNTTSNKSTNQKVLENLGISFQEMQQKAQQEAYGSISNNPKVTNTVESNGLLYRGAVTPKYNFSGTTKQGTISPASVPTSKQKTNVSYNPYTPRLSVNNVPEYFKTANTNKGPLNNSSYQKQFAKNSSEYSNEKKINNALKNFAYSKEIGQYGLGNIDLYNRPQYINEDGSLSTISSMSFNENGIEILIPTIAFDKDNKPIKLSEQEAINRYHNTGEYLGKFNSVKDANDYADFLHKAQDFYYGSKYKTTAKDNVETVTPNAHSGYYTDTGFEDIDYDYINKNKTAKLRRETNHIVWGSAETGVDNSFLEQMTDEEIAVYNYLYKTDKNTANKFIEKIAGDLNLRSKKKSEESAKKYAEEHSIKASIESVLTSPMKSISYVGQVVDYLDDGKVDQNAEYNKFSYNNSAIRSKVAENIEKSGKWGKVGSYAYNLGMSMGDFVINTAITGGYQPLSLAIMGTSSAADTVIISKDKGLTDNQAMALGTIAGAAEVVFEKISLDKLFSDDFIKHGLKRYIKANAFTEGLEETGTSLTNLFADILISGDKSEWQESINNYMNNGYTKGQAIGMTVGNQALSLGLDFIGGVISGSFLAGGNAVANYVNISNEGKKKVKKTDSILNYGLKAEEGSLAYENAKKLRENQDLYKLGYAKKGISNYELGRQIVLNEQFATRELGKNNRENVEKVIDLGLKQKTSSSAYTDAVELQKKIKAGKYISDEELGQAIRDIQEEYDNQTFIPPALEVDSDTKSLLSSISRSMGGTEITENDIQSMISNPEAFELYTGVKIQNNADAEIRQYVENQKQKNARTNSIISAIADKTELTFDYDATLPLNIAGYYDHKNKKIVLNPASDKALEYAVVHELTHFVENKQGYKVYKDNLMKSNYFINEFLVKNEYKNVDEFRLDMEDKYKDTYKNLSAEEFKEAIEYEMNAKVTEELINSEPAALERLSRNDKGIKAVFHEIAEFFEEIMLKLNGESEKAYALKKARQFRKLAQSEKIGKVKNYRQYSINNTLLTQDEEDAILKYKSSDSYKINEKLYSAKTLSDIDKKFVENLNSALDKLPKYKGKVYRNITFYFKGKDAFDEFVNGHIIGNEKCYNAFTSASKVIDGYEIDADLTVHIEIESINGVDVEIYGNQEEREILFKTDAIFEVLNVENYGNYANIKLKEVSENDRYEKTETVSNDERNKGNFNEYDSREKFEQYNSEIHNRASIVREGREFNDSISAKKSQSDRRGNDNQDRRYNIESNSRIRYDRNGEGQTVRTVVENSQKRTMLISQNKDVSRVEDLRHRAIQNIFKEFSIPLNQRTDLKSLITAALKKVEQGNSPSEIISDSLFNLLEKKSKVVDDSVYNEYKDLKELIRTTKLLFSEGVRKDFPEAENFRKSNMGILSLNQNEGRGIDDFYQELCNSYPDVFSDEIVNSADQLREISDVAHSITKENLSVIEAGEKNGLTKEYFQEVLNSAFNEHFISHFENEVRKGSDKITNKQKQKYIELKAGRPYGELTELEMNDYNSRLNKEIEQFKKNKNVDTVEKILNRFDKGSNNIIDTTEYLALNDDAEDMDTNSLENFKEVPAQLLKGNQIGMTFDGKDIYRNNDMVSNGSKTVRSWLSNLIEKPLENAKGKYVDTLKNKVNYVYEKIVKDLGIQMGSKESAAVQWYGEGMKPQKKGEPVKYTLDDLKTEFPEKWQKIVEANKILRQMYLDYIDEINGVLKQIYPNVEKDVEKLQKDIDTLKDNLDTLNMDTRKKAEKKIAELEERIDNLYTNRRLRPRKDYYRHIQEEGNGFTALMNILKTDIQISPDLIKVSENTKPLTKWWGALQHREGDGNYKADGVGAILNYIPNAEYKIHIEPFIGHMRKVINSFLKDTSLTKNANGYIHYLINWTNDLAGKTNTMDRWAQNELSRKIMGVVDWIGGRARANAIVGNLRTAVVQVFNLPNATMYIKNPKDWGNGIRSMIVDMHTGSQIINQSVFMKERYLDSIYSKFKKGIRYTPEKLCDLMLTAGDKATTTLIWYSAFSEGVRKKLDDPVLHADRITRRSVAGRGIGELPLMQKSRVVKMLAPFQVEVANSWEVMKEKGKQADVIAFIWYSATAWALNALSQSLFGDKVIPDIVDIITDAFKQFDDDEPVLQNVGQSALRVGGGIMSAMPFASVIASGLIPDEELREQIFGDDDPSRYGVGMFGIEQITNLVLKTILRTAKEEDYIDFAASYLLPYGGKQLARSYEGYKDVSAGGSYTDKGQLRFPITTPRDKFKTIVFGAYSTKKAQDYLEELKPLGDKQTKIYKQLLNLHNGRKYQDEIYYTFKGYSEYKKELGKTVLSKKDRAKYVNTLSPLADMPESQHIKDWFINNVDSREDKK